MIAQLKTAADSYNAGLLTADEFLGQIITHVGPRWSQLADNPDDAFDVDQLATVLSNLKPAS